MSTEQTPYEAKRELVYAEKNLADSLTELAELEEKLGRPADAAEDFHAAAKLETRANELVHELIDDLKHQDDEPPAPSPNGKAGRTANPASWRSKNPRP